MNHNQIGDIEINSDSHENVDCNKEEVLKHIDLIIRNLSDNGPNLPPHSSTGRNNKKQKVIHDPGVSTEIDISLNSSPSCHGNDDNDNVEDKIENNEEDSLKEFHRRFAPAGLERQYHELYQILEKGLIGATDYSDHHGSSTYTTRRKKTNVSALLMGPRGEGKSLVLDRCLLALEQRARDEDSKQPKDGNADENSLGARFRVVRLNGVLLRGENVVIVVQEIVRQLCEIVTRESCLADKGHTKERIASNLQLQQLGNDQDQNKNAWIIQEKLQQIMHRQAQQFRSKVTTFNSTMACLNEAFQISCIDSIPILIVLEELDSFLPAKNSGKVYRADGIQKSITSSYHNQSHSNGKSKHPPGTDSLSSLILSSPRDLLLYHLLDRVAGKGSLISLVGMCARLTTTDSYEKRVRSRAQGTSTVIYFNLYPPPSMQRQRDDSRKLAVEDSFYAHLVHVLMSHFVTDARRKVAESSRIDSFMVQLKDTVHSILSPEFNLQHNQDERAMDEKYRIYKIFRINREMGKSIRWFCRVLSIALTLYSHDIEESQSLDSEESSIIPSFNENYFLEGLQAMGADDFVSERRTMVVHLDTTGGEKHTPTTTKLHKISSREHDLMSLSGCQVAILVSAKRIMERDFQSDHDGLVIQKPLTYERIRREYESYFVMKMKSVGPDCYSEVIFFKAFLQMLGRIFFIEKDHTEGGPNQYYYSKRHTLVEMHPELLKKSPLHVGVDVEKDVMTLLLAGKLNCSMALKDWAKVNCA
jgi:hypothetical protein